MIVPNSNMDLVKNELKDILTNNNILVKYMEDDMFDTTFNMDCKDVEIDISDDTFLHIAKLAHEEDITFNQMVTKILKEQLDKGEK